jgi:hypothetical protein
MYALPGTERVHEFLTVELGYTSLLLFTQERYQIYAAVVETGDRGSRVIARCILLTTEGSVVTSHQELPEGNSPASFCPAKILNLLSPSDDLAVLRWRVRCRAYNHHLAALWAGKLADKLKTDSRAAYRLQSASVRVWRERASLDHSLLQLSMFAALESNSSGAAQSNSDYFVKAFAREDSAASVYVEFEGLGGARVAFYVPASVYTSWPPESFPTVADFAASGEIRPARLVAR